MAVTMKDVRAILDPEEPDYQQGAKLGPQALPHLEVLVSSDDPMLASKAVYLASLIKGAKASEVVEKAARSDIPAVRVAAAAAAANLSDPDAVLLQLVGDADPGVSRVARRVAADRPSDRLAERLRDLGPELEPDSEAAEQPELAPIVTGLMPGETSRDMPSGMRATMPGEQGKMPGE